jgi:flagellar hook-associated protein 1 FlgK
MAVTGVGNLNTSLFTALSGIQTTQQLLSTTSRNITNAQTVGYVNKTQQAVSNAATGGVLAGAIKRFIDASLQQKLRTNNADAAFAQARQAALNQMNQLAGDPAQGTSISAKINVLQTDFQQLSANPQSTATAQNILGTAHDLALTFNEQTNALFALQGTAFSNVTTEIGQINTDLQQIANLNQQVVNAQANGKDPTDLQDQRDNAVNDLSNLMGVNAFIDNQGVLQVLSADFKPLAGLYAEVVTFNNVTNTVSVAGSQLATIGGKLGANLQVATADTVQRLQNLSEVANHLTSAFQGLPTSIVQLGGTLSVPPPAPGGLDIAVPGVTKLITDNGSQYSATLAYRSTATPNTYQLVISNLTAIQGAPQVTNNGYVAATGTGGYVLGTITFPAAPPLGQPPLSFTSSQVQLIPSVASTQPGKINGVTAFTAGLTSVAPGLSAPTNITSNDTINLFTQTDGARPHTTMTLNGSLPGLGVEPVGDTAASAAFTLITDLGNQYTATIAYRPATPGANGSGYQVVVTSLTPTGSAPGVGNLNYNGPASTGGLVIGTFDSASVPPTFQSTGTITAIPATGTAPALFPGHILPIVANSTVVIGAFTGPGVVTATNDVTAPYYSGNIELNPNLSLRALAVGDQFAATLPDTNAGAAMAAATALNNFQFAFSTTGISGNQTLGVGSGAMTIGIGQDLANTNNQITTLTTANTQIQRAIAPNSEVNLDTEMSHLVVLQNLYQANARVASTVTHLLDTLIQLPT